MAVSFGKGRVRCQRVRSWRPLNREAYCSFLYIHQLGRENRKDEVSEFFRPCFVFSDDRRIQPRDGDIYSSCYDISVTQHDVLRHLALHLSNNGSINQRTRLLMPRREIELPREWDRHSDEPFQARIVSNYLFIQVLQFFHLVGEMTEMDWFEMEFPKAEVLILNFASNEYMLPPFIRNMPKLKALIMINYGASNAILHDFSVLSSLSNLRSLWLEKVSVPPLSPATFRSKKVRKISLILCKINNSLDESVRNIGKKERERETAMTKFTISFCTRLQGVLLLVSKPNSSAPFSSKPTKTRRLTNQAGMTKSLRRSQRD